LKSFSQNGDFFSHIGKVFFFPKIEKMYYFFPMTIRKTAVNPFKSPAQGFGTITENQGHGKNNGRQTQGCGKNQRPTAAVEQELNDGIEKAEQGGQYPDAPGAEGDIPAGFGADKLDPLGKVSRQGDEGNGGLA
jgi:hypothetical protein